MTRVVSVRERRSDFTSDEHRTHQNRTPGWGRGLHVPVEGENSCCFSLFPLKKRPDDLLTSPGSPLHNGPEPQAVAMATGTAVALPRLVSFIHDGLDAVSQRPGADQRGGLGA